MNTNKRNIVAYFIIIISSILAIGVLGFSVRLHVEGKTIFDVYGEIIKEDTPIASIGDINSSYTVGKSKDASRVVEPTLEETVTTSANIEMDTQKYYYYSQLDKNAKIIYKGFLQNKENLESGNFKIDFDKQFNSLLNTSEGEETLNIAFQSAWNAFSYDNVDLFYIDVSKMLLTTETKWIGPIKTSYVYISNGSNESYLSKSFETESEVRESKQYLKNIRNQVEASLVEYDDYEKVKHVHNWLINNLEYDVTLSKANIHNIYGALRNGEVVCEGYARAFKYLLDGLNIPCILVSGKARNSDGQIESHAWNYVMLNDKWYAVDVTWDDPIITGNGIITDTLRYKHFLKGSDEFFEDHTENGVMSANSMKFTYPELNQENYNKQH